MENDPLPVNLCIVVDCENEMAQQYIENIFHRLHSGDNEQKSSRLEYKLKVSPHLSEDRISVPPETHEFIRGVAQQKCSVPLKKTIYDGIHCVLAGGLSYLAYNFFLDDGTSNIHDLLWVSNIMVFGGLSCLRGLSLIGNLGKYVFEINKFKKTSYYHPLTKEEIDASNYVFGFDSATKREDNVDSLQSKVEVKIVD